MFYNRTFFNPLYLKEERGYHFDTAVNEEEMALIRKQITPMLLAKTQKICAVIRPNRGNIKPDDVSKTYIFGGQILCLSKKARWPNEIQRLDKLWVFSKINQTVGFFLAKLFLLIFALGFWLPSLCYVFV